MLKISLRLLNKYLSSFFTFLIYFKLREDSFVNEFASIALFTSFTNYIPVFTFGMNTKLLLHSSKGNKDGFFALGFFSILISSPFIYYFTANLIFTTFFSVSLILLLISRDVYSVDPDRYLLKSLPIQLLIYAIMFFCFEIIPIEFIGVSIIVAPLISGLRLNDMRVSIKVFNIRSIIENSKKEINWMLLALLSIATVWSNQLILSKFSTSQQIKLYDSYWKLWTVTFFAQMILSHELPKLSLDFEKSDFRTFLSKSRILSRTIRFLLIQIVLFLIIFPFYIRVFNVDFEIYLLIMILVQGVLFGLIIPFNYFFHVRNTNILLRAFGVGAFFALVTKILLPISAISMAFSTVIGSIISIYVFYRKAY